MVVQTLLMGIALGAVLLGIEGLGRASHLDAYQEIELGASRDAASSILAREGIRCQSNFAAEQAPQSACEFDDFWRAYLVRVDPISNVVVIKQVSLKSSRSIGLKRFFR
jgi:hypothetical protein